MVTPQPEGPTALQRQCGPRARCSLPPAMTITAVPRGLTVDRAGPWESISGAGPGWGGLRRDLLLLLHRGRQAEEAWGHGAHLKCWPEGPLQGR